MPKKLISCPNFLEGHHILSQESFDAYIFSAWQLYTYSFFSSLRPCNTQNELHAKDSVSQMLRTRRFSISFYIFCKFSKITLEFISELINMKYSFNIPFKFSLKITRELLLNSLILYSVENFTHTQLRVTASELDSSKETFVKAWSSLSNNNGNLNIQFNQFSQISSQLIWKSFCFICCTSCLLASGVNTHFISID